MISKVPSGEIVPYVGLTAYSSFFVVLVRNATKEFVLFFTLMIHSDLPYNPATSGRFDGLRLKYRKGLSNSMIFSDLIRVFNVSV